MDIKRRLDQELLDAGVAFLFGCSTADLLTDRAGRVAGVVFASKSGLFAVRGAVVIDATPAALLARMALQGRLKVVTTLHGTDITVVGSDPSYLPMVRLAIRESDGVTAVSEFLRQETLRTFQVERPIEVIPNFVQSPALDHRQCRAWLAPQGTPVLTHISNFRPVKRVMDVVKVFEILRQRTPARLVMVGDGPDRAEAEAYARERGFAEEVRFTGKFLEICTILACTDLFLLPSATESFGLAALEAMAYGVPVIASRVGGLPEVVRHGVDGYLEPQGDVAAMAEDALRLIQNDALRREMGKSAQARALATFAPGPAVDKYEALYEQVLAPRKSTVDLGAASR